MNTVKDFLVELGTEELPPKSLRKLSQAFHDSIVEQLSNAKLSFESSVQFATPRRLAVKVKSLQVVQDDQEIERLGPPVSSAFDKDNNPKPAALGFAKSCGTTIDKVAQVETDKGLRLSFKIQQKGHSASELLPQIVEKALLSLPAPRSMRWGNTNCEFIRPPHWLLVLLGTEVVPMTLLELSSSNTTQGHRFHSIGNIAIKQASDYEETLLAHKVMADFDKRQNLISSQISSIAKSIDATAVINDDLLEEVTALVEWPTALMGKFSTDFLQVPSEALIATMQKDQKYFHLLDSNNKLLPRFITVSNIESSNPQSVISGNERVIAPRLSDAQFFYRSDCKTPLIERVKKLDNIIFQKSLGSLAEKCQRVKSIANKLVPFTGANSEDSDLASLLCKADLMTDMVYEFPELQGIMGRYYAANDGYNSDVSAAMEEIYKPKFSGDSLPRTNIGTTLALADRIDTLVGIFSIGQSPTGAKDPFALRRAGLGIIRLLVENSITVNLNEVVKYALSLFLLEKNDQKVEQAIIEFLEGRFLSFYLDKGFSSQEIHSVVSASRYFDPADFYERLTAVQHFNSLDSSESLASANKRVSNILLKSKLGEDSLSFSESLLEEKAEIELFSALENINKQVTQNVSKKQYKVALELLSDLKDPVDQFFDSVMVNVESDDLRLNRLGLLNNLRNSFLQIADVALLQK